MYNQLLAPRASVNLTGATYTGGIHKPQFKSKTVVCAGASLRAAGTDGVLMVHPIDNDTGDNYPLDLTAGGGAVPFEFDYIVETGTTVTLANVDLIPKPSLSQTL